MDLEQEFFYGCAGFNLFRLFSRASAYPARLYRSRHPARALEEHLRLQELEQGNATAWEQLRTSADTK